jgi:hypothetical protein
MHLFFKFNHKAYKLVVFNYFLLTTSRLVLLLSIDMKLIHSVATTPLLLGMEFLIYIIVLNCFVEMLFKLTEVKEIIETIIRWSTKSLKRVETKSFDESITNSFKKIMKIKGKSINKGE